MVQRIPSNIPDLGGLGKPKGLDVTPAVLVAMPRKEGEVPLLIDARTLIDSIRAVVRQELDRRPGEDPESIPESSGSGVTEAPTG
jgi:hypothetical protein